MCHLQLNIQSQPLTQRRHSLSSQHKNAVLDLANMDISGGPDNKATIRPPVWTDPYSLAENDEVQVGLKEDRE